MDEIIDNGGFSLNLLEKAADAAQERVDGHLIAQADMLVWKDGRTLWSRQVGYEDCAAGTPLQPDRIFRLCSMSKPVTAVAIMIQVDRGLVKLDDPISKFIPGFADMRVAVYDDNDNIISSVPAQRQITVFGLLTHTSGLGAGRSAMLQAEYSNPSRNSTLAGTVPNFAKTLLEYQPGDRCEYSAIMAFDTLGYICELTSGMPYDKFLKANIFDPLGMNDTFFNPVEDSQISRAIKLYASTGDGFAEQNPATNIMGGFPMTYFSGAAGLLSTLGDYLRFGRMLLNSGELDGVRIISEASAKLIHTPQFSRKFPGMSSTTNWGLGMRVIVGRGSKLAVGSFGWSGAYGTHFWVDPANNMVCLFFSNMTTTGGAGAPAANEFEKNVMRALILGRGK